MTKSGKHGGKRRNCTFCAISSFVTIFSKSRLLQRPQKASIWGKGLKARHDNNKSHKDIDYQILWSCLTKLSLYVLFSFVKSFFLKLKACYLFAKSIDRMLFVSKIFFKCFIFHFEKLCFHYKMLYFEIKSMFLVCQEHME